MTVISKVFCSPTSMPSAVEIRLFGCLNGCRFPPPEFLPTSFLEEAQIRKWCFKGLRILSNLAVPLFNDILLKG